MRVKNFRLIIGLQSSKFYYSNRCYVEMFTFPISRLLKCMHTSNLIEIALYRLLTTY